MGEEISRIWGDLHVGHCVRWVGLWTSSRHWMRTILSPSNSFSDTKELDCAFVTSLASIGGKDDESNSGGVLGSEGTAWVGEGSDSVGESRGSDRAGEAWGGIALSKSTEMMIHDGVRLDCVVVGGATGSGRGRSVPWVATGCSSATCSLTIASMCDMSADDSVEEGPGGVSLDDVPVGVVCSSVEDI